MENPEKEGLTISRIQNIISGMDRKPVVYIMTNKPNGTLYTGVTSDLVQRVWEHRQGIHPGFSKRYGTKVLVWYEWHSRMDTAIAREKALKKWNRHWKVRMIEEFNADWSDLYPLLLG